MATLIIVIRQIIGTLPLLVKLKKPPLWRFFLGGSTPTRTEDGGFGDRCFTTKL